MSEEEEQAKEILIEFKKSASRLRAQLESKKFVKKMEEQTRSER